MTKLSCVLVLVITGCGAGGAGDDPGDAATPTGSGATVVIGGGTIDPDSPFFAALGTNGRSCATCHDQATGWSITPAALQARFDATGGDDPAFRLVDGATSPTADVSTLAARQTAYQLLLSRGVFRVGLPIPAGADFTLAAVDDPYGFASASELSLFRRPRPSTNLRFLVQVMWDGREPSLAHQATDATLGHAQAGSADEATMSEIVDFERALQTAAITDDVAGALPGPTALATQAFQPGENDPFSGAGGFTRDVFTLYAAWDAGRGGGGGGGGGSAAAQRQAQIARGEDLFNRRPIDLDHVPGLPQGTRGTCSTCHDTPNVGAHSVALAIDLGLAGQNRRDPGFPLYTLRSTATGATVQVTDPGRALVTGKLADAGKFFVPVLRGVGMRAPYFHDGSARSLDDVVDFYDRRFRIGLSGQDRADLVAFLGAL